MRMFVFVFTRSSQTFWKAKTWQRDKRTRGRINTNITFQNVFLVDLSKKKIVKSVSYANFMKKEINFTQGDIVSS